jgi:hypothetical protein
MWCAADALHVRPTSDTSWCREGHVTDSEMVEVISVDDHDQALAIMELLKAKGVPDVGF